VKSTTNSRKLPVCVSFSLCVLLPSIIDMSMSWTYRMEMTIDAPHITYTFTTHSIWICAVRTHILKTCAVATHYIRIRSIFQAFETRSQNMSLDGTNSLLMSIQSTYPQNVSI
jgi:phenylalanine-4-hydroxylase